MIKSLYHVRKLIVLSAFFIVAALLSSFSFGQTTDEGLAFLQLNFFNPGARALGMGGAFVAMADDATAALANPAGLTTLIKPEMSLEFSVTRYKNQIPWSSGDGTFEEVFFADGVVQTNFSFQFEPQDFPSTPKSLSFASFVYPLVKNKFVVSASYNEQTRYAREFHTQGFSGFLPLAPVSSTVDLSIKNIGFSSGFKPVETFSLGVTVNLSSLSLDSRTERRAIYDPGIIDQIFLETGGDNRFSYTLGALIKATKDFSVGGVYSKRPEFRVIAAAPFVPVEHAEILRIPDSFTLGFSLKPTERLGINMDVVRILYSQLMDGYFNAYYGPGQPEPFTRDFGKTAFRIPDGNEYRLGGEYVFFLKKVPFAIRGGYWREPFHGMTYPINDANFTVIFNANHEPIGNSSAPFPFWSRSFIQDYNHATFGAGVALKTFTIDWAYDHSPKFKRFIVSSVFYLDWLARK